MKRKRHTPEQIIRLLRDADTKLANGGTIPEVCKGLSRLLGSCMEAGGLP